MANLEAKINLYGTAPGSIVDGPGIRFGVFVQGCTHHCPKCHNPKSQPHKGGVPTSVGDIIKEFEEADSCAGVTLSGGEPFEQAEGLAELACALKEKGINVWCYSGYLFEDLIAIANGEDAAGASEYCNKNHAQGVNKLLHNLDVLVDGEFQNDLKSYDALYRGSKNQRLIDVPKSLENGKVIE